MVVDTEYAGAEITDAKYYSPQSKVAERIWVENLAALGVTNQHIENDDPTTDQIAMSTIGVQFKGRITRTSGTAGSGTESPHLGLRRPRRRGSHQRHRFHGPGGVRRLQNPDAEDAGRGTGRPLPRRWSPSPRTSSRCWSRRPVEAADDDPWATDDDSSPTFLSP